MIAIGIAVAFISLLAYGLSAVRGSTTIRSGLGALDPVPAPSFSLDVLEADGTNIQILPAQEGVLESASLDGRPVVLNFWASWCDPCRDEAPILEAGWKRDRSRGVLYLGVDTRDATGDAAEFIDEFGLTYPNVRDPDQSLGDAYGLTGIPETYFIDSRGRVVAGKIGIINEADLDAGVEAARAGRPIGLLDGSQAEAGSELEPAE